MTSKQAVLLIHGIGEQRPMDTLRGFVDTVWTTHSKIHTSSAGGASWSKPDNVSDSFELRRLTTPNNVARIRTDFFEFYWGHLMPGTTYGHLAAWARSLLWRWPGTVPPQLRGVYWLLIGALVLGIALAIYSVIAAASAGEKVVPAWLSTVLSVAVLPLVGFLLLRVVGDAARYLHVAPTNIQRRHEIRQAGLKVLAALHARGYERILVVGHSLGSVIGYDILTHAWAASNTTHKLGSVHNTGLDRAEDVAATMQGSAGLAQWQQAQRAYANELKANGNPWRVTDFITLGSPLAHAAVLLAEDHEALIGKQRLREFPTCPPTTEPFNAGGGKKIDRFSYPDAKISPNYRVPHHAAVFAATRWSNLYFPCRFIVRGDVVGGPLAPWFGRGIADIPVSTKLGGGFFSHTLYWKRPSSGEASHVDALRSVLDLIDQSR